MRVRPCLFFFSLLALLSREPTESIAREPTAWSTVTTPVKGKPQSHGGYSAGCIAGALELSPQHSSYQVMKPERRRHFGHPYLLEFIQQLAQSGLAKGLAPLAVGDLGQPRGGPAPSGHASHQSGLDVDLWFSPVTPKREQHSVVDLPTNQRTEHWTPLVADLLQLASEDPKVARIFVNPIIKKQLCDSTQGKRLWLRKLRPWYGHHEHFHVRLSCPDDSPQCKNQSPVPAGDGCQELDWWLGAQHKKDRKKGVAKYGKRVGAKPKLPKSCQAIRMQR